MKYRDYKIFIKGNYYHVFNRGVNRESIFIDENDYLAFLYRLRIVVGIEKNRSEIKPLPKGSIEIICYCLMRNHFHLVLKQSESVPISSLLRKLCTSYSAYFNKKYHRYGSLFQDTYKAKPIEGDDYLIYLSAYIHNNPQDPFSYSFSSINEYFRKDPGICSKKYILHLFGNNIAEYEAFTRNFVKLPKISTSKLFEM